MCDYQSEKCLNRAKTHSKAKSDCHSLFLPKPSSDLKHADEKEAAVLAAKEKRAQDEGELFESDGTALSFFKEVPDVEVRFAYKVEPVTEKTASMQLTGTTATKAYTNVIKHQDLSFLQQTKASALSAMGNKKQRARLTHGKLFRAVKKLALGSRVLRATNVSAVPERQIFAIGRVRPAKLHASGSDESLGRLQRILRLDEGKNRFHQIDADNSGSLSRDEWARFCRGVGLSIRDSDLRCAKRAQ